MRLSTEKMPLRNRREVVHEMYAQTVFRADLEPRRGEPFVFDVDLFGLPDLGVAAARFSECRTYHRAEHGCGEDLIFNLTLEGGRTVSQRGREVTLEAGEAVLASIDPVVTTMRPSRFLSFRLPRTRLEPLVTDLDSCLLQPIRHRTGALALLPSYIKAIDEATSAPAEIQEIVAAHVYDLIALTLGASRDARQIAAGRGVRAVRLRAIREDIIAHLADPALSVVAVAQRQGVSPRYVGMLFDGIGTTFSSFVLEQRLARARCMLADPRHGCRAIGVIAAACGFGDVSYFNRSFRRAFGKTPSDIRAGGTPVNSADPQT
jgi:AraC-like DNA-binding protein